MENKACRFCWKPFEKSRAKGSVQEFCSPKHRLYANNLRWLQKHREELRASHKAARPLTKMEIEKGVRRTVEQFEEALRKLGKE